MLLNLTFFVRDVERVKWSLAGKLELSFLVGGERLMEIKLFRLKVFGIAVLEMFLHLMNVCERTLTMLKLMVFSHAFVFHYNSFRLVTKFGKLSRLANLWIVV